MSRLPRGLRVCAAAVGRVAVLLSIVPMVSLVRADEPPAGPERWEAAVAGFERQDREQPPLKQAILFVGSSSIRLWKLSESFPDLVTINRGFGGSQIADSVHFAERLVLKHEPRTVVLYAGDNDIASGKSPQQVAADFKAFTAAIHERLPHTRIVFLPIKPSLRRWEMFETMSQANALIERQCADDDRLVYVDLVKPMLGDDGQPRSGLFVKDGLHLSDEGYRLWAGLLRPLLAERNGPNPPPDASSGKEEAGVQRRLYVACPGIRNYLEYGGHGLLVFDIDNGYRFVKRIPIGGLDEQTGKPLNVKGICASADTDRLHITTIRTMMCVDLRTEKLLWERPYEDGCDRMAVSPDGKTIYVPSFEKDHWHAVDALSGDVIARLAPKSGAHNTVYGLDGKHVYLAGLRSPLLSVADTSSHTIARRIGPFAASIRPFTVNGRQTLCFVNVNELLGFEIGDLESGRKLHRVEVQGFEKGTVKRHGCPSHGIGLTPDERELWVCDAANRRMHVFDATVMPPKQLASVELRDEPGWITFSLDGRYAWPSTGDVIETETRKVIAGLTDETGAAVASEKLVEVHWRGGEPVRAGDQFGLGRVLAE